MGRLAAPAALLGAALALTSCGTQKAPAHSVDVQAGELYPVTEQVNGLDPGTTYHSAVCAEDPENPDDASRHAWP